MEQTNRLKNNIDYKKMSIFQNEVKESDIDHFKPKIDSLLKKTKTKEIYHTHLNMGKFKEKYSMSANDINEFFSNYNPDFGLCIAEKQREYCPVIVDIDIKRKDTECNNERNNKHILEVINVYQQVLKEIINDINTKDLTCVFLDKPKYKSTQNNITYVKNGFHLHFPYIFLSKIEQDIHLIPRVKKEIKTLETFKDLGFDDSSKMIDNINSKPWLLYGCVKSEGMIPYTISKVFNHKCEEISLVDGFKNYPLLDTKEKKIKLNSHDDIVSNLPKILSVIPIIRDNVFKDIKHGLISPLEQEQRKQRKQRKQYEGQDIGGLEKAKQLVSILSNDRADDRLDWLKVGWIIFNISQGSEDGFQIWNDFSKRCEDKYNESVCEYEWSKMVERDSLTIGTLHYYAKIDNPKKYRNFIIENTKETLNDTLNGSHYDIAEFFQKIHGYDNVKITSQKELSCFVWNDKTKLWTQSTKESLGKLMSNILSPIYIKVGKQILEQLEHISDKGEQAMVSARLKQIQKYISNLKSTPYINNSLKALAGYEIDKDFETKIINKQPDELPIQNGKVINLRTLEIRDRIINDYWSFECDVSFLGEKADLNCVKKFFNDICCNSSKLVNYHQRLWGYMLTGEISDRSLHIFWGNGCNGKSTIVNIFSNITNNFTVSLNEDVMLKKTSRGANPEMMPLLTARCGALPESDKREELNSKRVKSITGDDMITARHLFGHALSFKTQCKPIWATNHKPKINVDDQAILDRLKLIPFLGRFEKNQQNTEYIKDLQENKLNEFFTWFCLGAYDWYNGEELIPCDEMKTAMNTYVSENDVVGEFISDTYNLISKEEYQKLPKLDKVSWVQNRKNSYCEFMAWIQDNNRKDDIIGKKDFITQINKKVVAIKTSKITNGFLAQRKEVDFEDSEYGETINLF